MHFTYSYSSGSQANRYSNCCTAGALWSESLIMKIFISQKDKFHQWNEPFSRALQLLETGDQYISEGRKQGSHPISLHKLQALTALAEEVRANPTALPQKQSCPSRANSCDDRPGSDHIPCPSLQGSCCLPYSSLSATISPPAYLCGCVCCHSKLNTNLIQQHLIIISS